MTDSLATKQDLRHLEVRCDARFDAIDSRFEEIEKRMALRFEDQSSRFDAKLADLERRMTMRLGGITVACFGAFSALTKIL